MSDQNGDDDGYTGGWEIEIGDDGSVSSTDDGGEADDYGLRDDYDD